MSSSDVTEDLLSGNGSTEKEKEKDTENPIYDEDFVVIDRDSHTHHDDDSSVPFSVSTNKDFLSNTDKDNGTVKLDDVQIETSRESRDVTENTEKIPFDVGKLKLRPQDKGNSDNETEPFGLVEMDIAKTQTTKERVDVKVEIDQSSSSVDMLNLRSTDEEIKGKIMTTFKANSSPDGQEIVRTEILEAARQYENEDNKNEINNEGPNRHEHVKTETVEIARPATVESVRDNSTPAIEEAASAVEYFGDDGATGTNTEYSTDMENDQFSNKDKEGKNTNIVKKFTHTVAKKVKGVVKSSDSKKDIDVLLIGKTGNGKSRTGNMILHDNVFKYADSSTSETKTVQHGYTEYSKRRIKVVDSPGIEDTGNMYDFEKATSYLIDTLGDVITKHPDGYHAILIVVRYGNRFTKEDKSVIETLKSIFGEDIVRRFSILLMTFGDLFETNNETNKTFKQWCSEQTGVLKELMEECGNRVVLFDNRTKDAKKQNKQLKKLIKTIDDLQSRGMRYDHHYFQSAKKYRDHLLVSFKEPRILEETSKESSIIFIELQKLENDCSEECTEKLKALLSRAFDIKSKIQLEDNETGALSKALEVVDSLCKIIQNRLHLIYEFSQKEKSLKEERASLMQAYDERMKEIINAYEEKRSRDDDRQEREKKEMEKKWTEREKEMQVIFEEKCQIMLKSVENEKNVYQSRMEDLERERKNSDAEAKSQIEENIENLRFSMNELNDREKKEKQTLQDDLNKIIQTLTDEKNAYDKKINDEKQKINDDFEIKKKQLDLAHDGEIKNMKIRELNLVADMNKNIDELNEVKKDIEDLKKELFDKTGTLANRLKNLCVLM